MSQLPGQPGSPNPAANDWLPRKVRDLEQQIAQLRGQLSRLQLQVNGIGDDLQSAGIVTAVTVNASTLTVTYGDGSTHTYQLA